MNPNLRRLALLIGIPLVGVSLLIIIYFVFFRQLTPSGTNANGGVGGQIPGVGNGNINGVFNRNGAIGLPNVNGVTFGTTPGDIASPDRPTFVRPFGQLPSVGDKWTIAGGSIQYYDPTKGQFFRVSPDGTRITLLSNTFYPQVQNVTWSPDGTKAALSFPDQSKVIVDFSKDSQATLPKESNDFSFSKDSSRVAFKFLGANPDDRYLVVTDPDGSALKQVEKLGANDAFVQPNFSPDNTVVATFQKGGTATSSEILFLGQNGENFKSLPVPGRNFSGQWSPDGSRMLFSVVSPLTSNNPELFIVDARGDAIGQNLLDLGITTSADKCTFSDVSTSVAYCAIPDHLDPDSGLFPGLTQNETDRFYRIDLASGQRTLLADPVDPTGRVQFNAQNLTLSGGEDVLYFTDAATGQVYTVRLR